MTIILKAVQFIYETISIRGGVHQLCFLTSAIIHPRGVFYTFNSRFTQYSTNGHQNLHKKMMLFILLLLMFLLSHATEIFWQMQEYFRKMNKSNELQNGLVYENINILSSFFWMRKSHRSVRLRKWSSHWQENSCRWLKIWNLLAFYFSSIKKKPQHGKVPTEQKPLNAYEETDKEEKTDDTAACCPKNEWAPKNLHDLLCTQLGLWEYLQPASLIG